MKKKQDIVHTDYRNTDKWKIVNDFTIHENRELSDRPFMQTKVPKQLRLDLKDIRVVDAYNWSGAFWVSEMAVNDDGNLVSDKETEYGELKYTQRPYITARAEIEDEITVFSVEEGALLQFDEIASIQISPTPIGKIGGKANATILCAFEFSGMSPKDVPEKGLMEGEPGRLWLNTDPFLEDDGDEVPNGTSHCIWTSHSSKTYFLRCSRTRKKSRRRPWTQSLSCLRMRCRRNSTSHGWLANTAYSNAMTKTG